MHPEASRFKSMTPYCFCRSMTIKSFQEWLLR